jgi:membrane-associated phospholipid phosphatase
MTGDQNLMDLPFETPRQGEVDAHVEAAPARCNPGISAGRGRFFPQRLRCHALWPGLMAALLALAMIPFASQTYHPIYAFLRQLPLDTLYASATQFPSFPLVFLILAGIWRLRPRLRPTLAYFLIAILLASSASATIKSLTSRARPLYSIQMEKDERAWLEAVRREYPGLGIQLHRHDQWLGPLPRDLRFKDSFSSFPSGHATSCFVLATYLSALFPEGRVLWYLAAGSTAAARVAKNRHWPEDVLFGGALGWTVAKLVFSWCWPGRLGLWLFRRPRRPGQAAPADNPPNP